MHLKGKAILTILALLCCLSLGAIRVNTEEETTMASSAVLLAKEVTVISETVQIIEEESEPLKDIAEVQVGNHYFSKYE